MEMANITNSTVKIRYFCLIGKLTILSEIELEEYGFIYDEQIGFYSIVDAKMMTKLSKYLKSKNIRFIIKPGLPNKSLLANSQRHLNLAGQKLAESCPCCNGTLEIRESAFGKYKYCSRFLLGCNYQVNLNK